jgi:hypothetical protein
MDKSRGLRLNEFVALSSRSFARAVRGDSNVQLMEQVGLVRFSLQCTTHKIFTTVQLAQILDAEKRQSATKRAHEANVLLARNFLVGFLLFGTFFFGVLYEWGLGNSFYFAWVTMTTIGNLALMLQPLFSYTAR